MKTLRRIARWWPGVLLVLVLIARWFGPHGSAAESDAFCEEILAQGKSAEAREWFYTGDEAGEYRTIYELNNERSIEIIEDLYSRGAVRVDAAEIDSEPGFGETTDVLIVTLPDDQDTRRKLFAFQGWRSFFNGLSGDRDHGQKYLFLWWD